MKDDSDSDEAARTTSAVGAAVPLDSNHDQSLLNTSTPNETGDLGSSTTLGDDVKLNNSAISTPEMTISICSNLDSAEHDHYLQNSITSSGTLERVANSQSSGTDTLLGDEDHLHHSVETFERVADSLMQDLVDMDEHDMHRVDEERETSPNVLSVPEKNEETIIHESGVDILERAANSPMQDCTNTPSRQLPATDTTDINDNNTETADDEGNSVTAKGEINLERVSDSRMQAGANKLDNRAGDTKEDKEDTIGETQNSPLNLLLGEEDSTDDTPSTTKKIASMSQEYVQNMNENCTESREQPGKCIAKESISELNAEKCEKDNVLEKMKSGEESLSDSNEQDEKDDYLRDSGKVQDSEPQHEVTTTEGLNADTPVSNAKDHELLKASTLEENVSPLLSVANQSPQLAPSQTTARTAPPKSRKTQFVPLKKSTPLDRTSLLTRGMSFFAKSSMQTRFAKNDDVNSIISELSQDVKSEKSVSRLDNNDDDALRQHLEESGLVLLKRLIEFLSECPPTMDEGTENSSVAGRKKGTPISKQKKKQRGLTLPASAIGWLSTQINGSCNDAFEGMGDCYQIPKQQLQCIQTLLKRVTSLRISGEAWPPPHASTIKATNPEKVGISSKILSKFSGDQSIGGDSLDDESCATAPSRVGESNETEILVSAFHRYYHELQYKPNVDMSFVPNATKVVIDGIPPNWITNLDLLQNLDMFQMEKGCILNINQLFFPSDVPNKITTADVNRKSLTRDLSLIDEGKEKEGSRSLPDDPSKLGNASFVEYSSLSKLRLSNCAIGETAGLRGRATSKSVPRLPTFSRFPNLLSLNLSRNELFKTKTVFAGLSSLPLLSSINLSYNRLSSLDDIFMHIGNVTELILTGNEISSTRGLDRLFSLERLSLDENNIHNLANIAGIAKIPGLMNIDLKGNTLETDDPESCRIKVFNLFREVRCNGLPKNATFRDMQRLLPILDNELATKDELVALKDLTFRQTVIPVDSMLPPENKNGYTDSKHIDDSSEISINMPDSSSGGIRRIVKSSPAKSAHFRMAGSTSLEKRAAGRLERFHGHVDRLFERKDGRRQVSVQFNMPDLITSIRPQMNTGDTSTIGERDRNSCSGVLRAMSFSSHRSEGKDGNTVASSPAAAFPFSLPSALLAEADDDVWTPYTHLDLIVPSDTIIWDITPSDDDIEQNATDELVLENEAIEHDDVASDPPIEEPNENIGPHPHTHVDEGSVRPNDATQISSFSQGQESVDENGHVNDYDNADEETSDLKSGKSMFGGIWEQSYRDNVTRNTKAVLESIDSTERTTPALLDFNAAEQNSQYDGPSDYGPLFVSSDLDLYFDSYVFHRDSSEGDLQEGSSKGVITAPKIQLFKFDRDLLINSGTTSHSTILPSTTDFHERFIGVWKEDVLACGSYARSRLSNKSIPKRGFHGETVTHAGKDTMISESRKFILCLSDSALYFIIDDEISPQKSTGGKRTFPSRVPPNSTFSDAHWPHAVVRHSLDCLSGITIGFQFQRLILRFCVGNSSTSSTLEYAYVILTSNKLQTVSFLQKIQSHVTDTQPGMGALIDNDDKTFLDALGAPRSNEVVIHYQILHQIWKRGDREASRRAFVLTDSKAYLIDETYNGDGAKPEVEKDKREKLGDVSLAIIDSASLSRVAEVRAANEDPRKITLVILPKNKLKRSHRWRLVCNDGEGAERLIDDVRKAMGGHL